MPVITIQSLPFDNAPGDQPDLRGQWLKAISQDFAKAFSIDIKHITMSWDFFSAQSYCVAGETASHHTAQHPLKVHLLVPDFTDTARQQQMLETLAASISEHSGVDGQAIFIHLQLAQSGQVFDAGGIVHW